MSANLRVIETDHREDRARTTPILKYSQIRSGLWTTEHEDRIGDAIWLYGWLHSRVDRRSGVLRGYTHAAAASDSPKSLSVVKRRFDRLRREGYITTVRRQYGLDVTITNYRVDEADPSPPRSVRVDTSHRVQKCQIRPPEVSDPVYQSVRSDTYIDLPEVQSTERETVRDARTPAPPPKKKTTPRVPAKASGTPKTDNPINKRLARIIDLIRQEGVTIKASSRDATELRICDASEEEIADAYVTAKRGEWGTVFVQTEGALRHVIQDLGKYAVYKRGAAKKSGYPEEWDAQHMIRGWGPKATKS